MNCQLRTHDCHLNSQCTNTHGNFSCKCNKGYDGNGTVCDDVDECVSNR